MRRAKLFLITIFISTSFYAQDKNQNRGYIVNVGQVAPDFEMELISGGKVKLSDLRGKIVMLQFTASWCGVCRKEMPYIENDIWKILKDKKDFSLFGIDRDEPRDKVIEFTTKVGVTYPVGLDPNAEIFQLYALQKAGITRNVIIDKEGKIIYLTRLFNKAEFEEMKKVIFSALGI